jgi:hypothetical protein
VNKWEVGWSVSLSLSAGFQPEAKFLDEIQTKVLRVILLAIHSHLYNSALRFLILQSHATSYLFLQWVMVHCKGERRKYIKPNPRPWFKKSIQKSQVWELSRLCPATWEKLNCTFMNSASGMINRMSNRARTVLSCRAATLQCKDEDGCCCRH